MYIQNYCKLSELLHKLIGKKVTKAQKLKARHCKEQHKGLFVHMRNSVNLIFVWLLLSCQ
jgi:hypothetical protein